jgi:hypothetical protein
MVGCPRERGEVGEDARTFDNEYVVDGCFWPCLVYQRPRGADAGISATVAVRHRASQASRAGAGSCLATATNGQ